MSSSAPPDAPFRWRAELPWIALAALAAALVRWPVIAQAQAYCHGDMAVIGLMAQHIRSGVHLPAFYYAQDYIGSLGAFAAAPLTALLPGDPRALGLAHVVVLALAMPMLYRLLHGVGGRAGALAATLLLALGTPELLRKTGGEFMAYQETLILGVAVLLAGQALIARPGAWLALLFGLLVGLGWWNHPQISSFIGAVAVIAWGRGRLLALREAGQLGAALRARVTRKLAAAGALAGLATVIVSLVVAWGWGEHGTALQLGSAELSLAKPNRYLKRGILLFGASLFALEALLAVDRRRWLGRLALIGLGASLGLIPQVLHRAAGRATGWGAPMNLQAADIADKLPALVDPLTVMLHGPPHLPGTPAGSPLARAYGALHRIALGVLLIGLLIWLSDSRGALWDLARLRPVAAGPSLTVQVHGAIVLVLLLLIGVSYEYRYVLPLWLTEAGLIAWLVAWLARAHPGRAVAFVLLLAAPRALAVHDFATRWLPAVAIRDTADTQPMIDDLLRRELTVGWADYGICYRLTYLSDERLIVAQDRGSVPRVPWHLDRARAAAEVVVLFKPGPLRRWGFGIPDDPADEVWFLDLHGDQILERWRIGTFRAYRMRQPPPYTVRTDVR